MRFMRRARSSIATAPISTRSSARCGRATSASTRCTSICKTFSTPHGGGGPGSGPVVLSEALAPYGPLPFVAKYADGSYKIVEEETAGEEHPNAFGRMVAFHGQMGMFTRALAYILSHGADGLKQVAEDSVLNANYILRSLEDVLDAPFAK